MLSVVPSHCLPLAAPNVLPGALKWLFTPDGPIYLKPRFDRSLFRWIWCFRKACNQSGLAGAMALLRELGLSSTRLFEDLARHEGLPFGFEKRGYLRVCKTESGLKAAAEEAELVKSVGVRAQVLTGSEIQRLEPNVRVEVLGGVSYPEDAHLNPALFVRGLAGLAAHGGVRILPSTEVFDFETSGRTVTRVKTTGDFVAGQIVVAAGAWAPEILHNLGIRLPIEGAKGFSFTFKKPAKCPATPFSLGEAGVALTPMGSSLRFAGTFAIMGMDLSWNRSRMRSMLHQVADYLPDLDAENLELLEVWRGLRPCTPDGLPFLGRSRMFENLIVAAGHAIVGVSLSPITGELVSQLLVGEESSIDLSLLRN